jgi:hypothetical protein
MSKDHGVNSVLFIYDVVSLPRSEMRGDIMPQVMYDKNTPFTLFTGPITSLIFQSKVKEGIP